MSHTVKLKKKFISSYLVYNLSIVTNSIFWILFEKINSIIEIISVILSLNKYEIIYDFGVWWDTYRVCGLSSLTLNYNEPNLILTVVII